MKVVWAVIGAALCLGAAIVGLEATLVLIWRHDPVAPLGALATCAGVGAAYWIFRKGTR